MAECTQEMQLKHAEILATLAADMKNMKMGLSDLGAIKDTLTELKILNVQSMEFNKRQIGSNDEFKKTLSAIDKNLTSLNERVGKIESTDMQEGLAKTEEKREDKRIFVERYKANMTFYGVIISCIVSLLSLFVAFALKSV
jgi:hypothetical protein